uniref:Ovule protein n=1 Tax=Caenorhabditis tropicalis TaxID=1561998 RepID=A0A1I7SXM0_9PELO
MSRETTCQFFSSKCSTNLPQSSSIYSSNTRKSSTPITVLVDPYPPHPYVLRSFMSIIHHSLFTFVTFLWL